MRPDLGSFAEEFYGRLEPFHERSNPNGEGVITDEQLDWPLLVFFGGLAKRWQEVEDLIRDTDGAPGWSALQSIDRIPDKGLPYLAQFRGKTVFEGMTPDAMRTRIRSTDGFDRGTPEALIAAAKRHLAEKLYINRVANPSSELTATAVTSSGSSAGLLAGAITRQSDWAKVGRWSSQLQINRNDASGVSLVAGRTATGASAMAVTPGEVIGVRVSGRRVNSPVWASARARVYFYKADGTASATASVDGAIVNNPGKGDVLDLFVAAVVPADAVFAAVAFLVTVNPAGVDTQYLIETDAYMLVRGLPAGIPTGALTVASDVPPYIDGSMPNGQWLGTPHNSATQAWSAPGDIDDPSVFVNERVGGNLWFTDVRTRLDQTPDPAQTFRDMAEQKHHGIILTHTVVDAWGYDILKVAFDDYGEVKTYFAATGYTGLKTENPPAP